MTVQRLVFLAPSATGTTGVMTWRFLRAVVVGLLLAACAVLAPASAGAAAAPTRVMALGDSITGSPGCWRALLWKHLQDTGHTDVDFVGTRPAEGCGFTYDGENEGHGGALVTAVADQNQLVGWLSSADPDVVLMHFGNKAAAEAYVEFLLSSAGQEVLLDKGIRRLPVRPETYAKAPADYPNPFKDSSLGGKVTFNSSVSGSRHAVVDTLYDQLITFQLDGLKAATKAIHTAEAALAKKDNPAGRELVREARDLIAKMPVTAEQAASAEIKAAFSGGKQKTSRQAELEQQWASSAKAAYAAAETKAAEAGKLAR
jgi:hypothetical protein